MAVVWIPPPLRDLTGGEQTVRIEGATVGQIVAGLEARYPGIRARLCEGEELRRGLAVVVGTEVARLGLLEPVEPESEVHFLPAISGG